MREREIRSVSPNYFAAARVAARSTRVSFHHSIWLAQEKTKVITSQKSFSGSGSQTLFSAEPSDSRKYVCVRRLHVSRNQFCFVKIFTLITVCADWISFINIDCSLRNNSPSSNKKNFVLTGLFGFSVTSLVFCAFQNGWNNIFCTACS